MEQVQDGLRADAVAKNAGIRWSWVFFGMVLGGGLIASLVPIMKDEIPRPDAAVLIGALTFVLTGILVGFQSPGKTLREPAISGVGLALLTYLDLRFVVLYTPPLPWLLAGLIAGPALSLIGGWVGEVLQGTMEPDQTPEGLQWPWIWAGTALGVMLTFYSIFLPKALFDFGYAGLFATFMASFFVVAFFVGYFSPGVTILEPAVAAFFIALSDFTIVLLGFNVYFPLTMTFIAGIAGFLIALVGGYLGEVAHNLRWGSSWGGAAGSYRAEPRAVSSD